MTDEQGDTVEITQLTAGTDFGLFRKIEHLHRVQLVAGALAHMPQGFLARFYRFLAGDTESVVIAATRNGRLVGFVTGTLRANELFKSFVFASPLRMVAYGIGLLFKPSLLVRIASISRRLIPENRTGSDRQLLSIAVATEYGRSGIGRVLFHALALWFRQHGAEHFDILSAFSQKAALQFYERHGASKVGETTLGGLPSILFRYTSGRAFPAADDPNLTSPRSPAAEK